MAKFPTADIPIEVPGWPDRFSDGQNFTFSNPLSLEAASWWVDRFTIGGTTFFPEDIAERLSRGMPGNIQCTFSEVIPEKGRVSIELYGTDDVASHIWFLGKTLWLDTENQMFTDLADIAEESQGQGFGRVMMGNCYDLAQELELDEMRLRASWIGTYAWLRFGFVPDQADWDNHLKAGITERLYEWREHIPTAAFLEVQRMLERGSPRTAWLIADDDTPVETEDGETVTLGQALLANSGISWDGSLLLDDAAATARFELYVGRQP